VPALSFLPIVWGDYWVLYIDNDYQYALVGEKSREYLWLLSRSNTQFNKHKIQQALNVAKEQGFDISKLVYSYKLDN
jgi:apolipoprotein D and lipocalin family protein